MRYSMYAMMVLILMLAACGGEEAPPATSNMPLPLPPTNTPTEEEIAEGLVGGAELTFDEIVEEALSGPQQPVIFPSITPESEGALPVPLPGTLVASETEEPEPRGIFDRIYFRQTGGTENIDLVIEIYSDGRIVQGDMTGRASQEQIFELDQAVNDLNFFGLQGTFMGMAASEESYRYRVAVSTGTMERAINSQDGFMPIEYARFLGLIRSVGDSLFTDAQSGGG